MRAILVLLLLAGGCWYPKKVTYVRTDQGTVKVAPVKGVAETEWPAGEVVEVRPYQELEAHEKLQAGGHIVGGVAHVDGQTAWRSDWGWLMGATVRRWGGGMWTAAPATQVRVTLGFGFTVIGLPSDKRDQRVIVRPQVGVVLERWRFVEHVPGERLPVGPRWYLEADVAPLFALDSPDGIELGLVAGRSNVGALVLRAGWNYGEGPTAMVGVRLTTIESGVVAVGAFVVAIILSPGLLAGDGWVPFWASD